MSERWDHDLTLVVAGAGFGKTTLLAEAIAENALSPRGYDHWLTCDQADADIVRLAHGLAQTLHQKPPDLRLRQQDPASLARSLADGIWQLAPQHHCLILDDVHDVHEVDADAVALLQELLKALPTNGHLVMATRREPPLALVRYELERHVARLDEGDLAMSAAELADFAALRDVTLEQLDGVGGWPALAELRALGHVGRVDDFLTEEVLSGLSDYELGVVATVAAIGGADRQLMTAVTGRNIDLPELLQRVPLASCDESGWCAIHPLWTARLTSYLSRAQRRRALRDAGRHLVGRDLLSAIALFKAADDHDGIEQAVRLACRPGGLAISAHLLERVHRDLPAGVRRRPVGKLLGGIAAAMQDSDRGIAQLEAARRAFEEDGDDAGGLLAIEQLAIHHHWREDVDALVRLWEPFNHLAHLPEAEALTTVARVLVADTAGDAHGILAALDEVDPAYMSEYWQAPIAWWRATALLTSGLPEAARRYAEMALAGCHPSLRGPFSMLLVNALFLCGDDDSAFAALGRMIDELEQAGNAHRAALGHAQAATHYALAGKTETAREHLARARTHAGPEPSIPVTAALLAGDAVVAVGSGDEAAAAALLEAQRGGRNVGEGRQLYGELRRLPLQYVLEPQTRTFWDQADLGPCYALARDVALAFVAFREDGNVSRAVDLGPEHWSIAPSFLPPNWRAELVTASASGGSTMGRREAEKLGPTVRPTLRELARRSAAPAGVRRWAMTLLDSLPALPDAPIEVGVLGVTTLRCDGRPIEHPHWRRLRVRMLLLLLVATGGGSRTEIAEVLWPDLDSSAAAHNLRVTLSYLLAVLEPDRKEGEPSYYVRSEGASIRLVSDAWLVVDAAEMERLLDLAQKAERNGEPSAALGHLTSAVDLYRGSYMAEAGYENWALPDRDRLSSRFVTTAVRAGQLTLAAGDPTRASLLASRALKEEPYSEPAHCLAVAAHLAAGEHAAARRSLDICRRQLATLGVRPGQDVEILERTLTSGLRRHE